MVLRRKINDADSSSPTFPLESLDLDDDHSSSGSKILWFFLCSSFFATYTPASLYWQGLIYQLYVCVLCVHVWEREKQDQSNTLMYYRTVIPALSYVQTHIVYVYEK